MAAVGPGVAVDGLVGRRVATLSEDVFAEYVLADVDWRAEVPDGLDSTSGETLLRGLGLLAPWGRTVLYGVASGDVSDIPPTSLFARRSVVGFSLLAWRAADAEAARRDVTELAEHFAAGRLRTTVHARLPLEDAATAHRLFEARVHLGRFLVLP
ncbi:zinc-binding dehydrogenase [Frankia sp. AgKG'84/4]|uniref:zinc-binding dehydrogenase n=1 Tax=Frankia sp. AgKG'84/4 TaxID=573490 RepID=UPI00200C131D|nr:zinc-binding dehydrogenase [Frankia sp. AgKG'84/4]MCL9792734.1 zinc-binding dehydrogenase [Frankia sp. AgKG'84/4]